MLEGAGTELPRGSSDFLLRAEEMAGPVPGRLRVRVSRCATTTLEMDNRLPTATFRWPHRRQIEDSVHGINYGAMVRFSDAMGLDT